MTDRNVKPEWWIELTRMHEEAKAAADRDPSLRDDRPLPPRRRAALLYEVREALAKFAGFGAALLLALGCGSADDAASALYRSTTRTYPDGGVTETLEPIGQMRQAIVANGFMGWRGDMSGLKRGSRCTFGPDAAQVCFVPASRTVRYYVDPVGFSAADLQVVQNQLAFHRTYWVDLLGIEDLGWTWVPGSAADHNAKLVAGSVNGALFPASDSRHWSQVGCESSASLSEPVALDGSWSRCGAVKVTLDVSKLLDDGAAVGVRNPRIKQTASQFMQWAAGLGLGNIYPGTTFQITASPAGGVVPNFENSQLCALETYSLGLKTEIRKAPLNACDGWEWP